MKYMVLLILTIVLLSGCVKQETNWGRCEINTITPGFVEAVIYGITTTLDDYNNDTYCCTRKVEGTTYCVRNLQ